MRAVCITLLLVTVLGGLHFSAGAPLLTKWFKTDNSTYYVEPEQKVGAMNNFTEQKKQINVHLNIRFSFLGNKLMLNANREI